MIIRSATWNELVDQVQRIEQLIAPPSAVDYYGYAYKDIKPYEDLLLNLGMPELRFKELHSGYGYFTYQVTVQGRPVIKDGDPITVAEDLTTKPLLVGYKVYYSAPAFVDVFDPDLVMSMAGRARFKFTLSPDAYAYTKWLPYGLAQAITSALNAGVIIPRDSWHEFDFTLGQNDKVNFRVTPSAVVTIFVYNIGSA